MAGTYFWEDGDARAQQFTLFADVKFNNLHKAQMFAASVIYYLDEKTHGRVDQVTKIYKALALPRVTVSNYDFWANKRIDQLVYILPSHTRRTVENTFVQPERLEEDTNSSQKEEVETAFRAIFTILVHMYAYPACYLPTSWEDYKTNLAIVRPTIETALAYYKSENRDISKLTTSTLLGGTHAVERSIGEGKWAYYNRDVACGPPAIYYIAADILQISCDRIPDISEYKSRGEIKCQPPDDPGMIDSSLSLPMLELFFQSLAVYDETGTEVSTRLERPPSIVERQTPKIGEYSWEDAPLMQDLIRTTPKTYVGSLFPSVPDTTAVENEFTKIMESINRQYVPGGHGGTPTYYESIKIVLPTVVRMLKWYLKRNAKISRMSTATFFGACADVTVYGDVPMHALPTTCGPPAIYHFACAFLNAVPAVAAHFDSYSLEPDMREFVCEPLNSDEQEESMQYVESTFRSLPVWSSGFADEFAVGKVPTLRATVVPGPTLRRPASMLVPI